MSNIRTYRVNHAMQMISIPLHSTTNSYHLGNNDEVVDAKGVVQQVTNYYPFGAPYADASATLNTSLQAYKYNGKEFDNMHGLNTYDYGARQYNPVTGRWDRMDPLCEKYYSTSPYAYCVNNPVRFIDPDGKEAKQANGGENFKRIGILTMAGGTLMVAAGTAYSIFTYGGGTVAGGGQLVSAGVATFKAGLVTYGAGAALDAHESVSKPNPTESSNSTLNAGKKKSDSGKNEVHGDGGRKLNSPSTVKQLNDLQAKIDKAKGKEKKQLEHKKRNIERAAQREKRGEEHSRGNKR